MTEPDPSPASPTEAKAGRTRSLLRRSSPRTRLIAGIVALLVALLVFAASRLLERGQRHAYDSSATPPATVHLTAGKEYQLSVPGGVPALKKKHVLTSTNRPFCFRTSGSVPGPQLTFTRTSDDDRDLTVFAKFRSDATGDFHVACQGIEAVFVDDADNAGFDYAGLCVLLATVIGVAGVGLTASGAWALSDQRAQARSASQESPAADPASAADTSNS